MRETDPIDKLARMYLKENALGTNLDMSIRTIHNADGQSERTIQTHRGYASVLCAIILERSKVDVAHCLLTDVGEAQILGPELIQETTEKIIQIKKRMQAARD
ncbi:hypothetical protein Tco_1249784 [Tanacetum coccineum]